jgi:hypothetical protein
VSLRSRIGHWMRKWADRIDDHGAPRAMGYRFTFEDGEGIRFREDGRGCRLWYYGMDDYEKAHTEADSAAADAEKAERRRLLEIAMSDPDPVKAGAAATELKGMLYRMSGTVSMNTFERFAILHENR